MLNENLLLKSEAYIGGSWTTATTSSEYAITNPATGDIITMVPDMGAADTQAAIDAAEQALPGWRGMMAKERATILRNWFNLIMENQKPLADLVTAECGKPLAEAMGEVVYGASFIEWFAEEGKRVYGDVIPSHAGDKRLLTIKQGIGVCAAITPWNFPIAMITRKCAPALAAGCTVVIKPAEATPLSALAMVELAEQAGFPKGVINVVTASHGAEVGKVLCDSPVVRKLSFTGSTPVGKLLMRQCADTVKKVSFELGGNAPFIVFDDADLDAAVAGAMASKYRNSGQTCVCANRLFVQDAIYDAFIEKLTVAVQGLKVGNGMDAGVTQGPLINQAGLDKAKRHVDDAIAKGATVVCGGKQPDIGGTFYEPTILSNVSTDMTLFREETFGPVAPVFRFKTEEEAVAMANDTEFGLASYFYSRDIGRVWRVAEALEYGMVGINEGIISTELAPFGGIKESGLGREGSKYGIDDFVEIKYLCMGGL